MGLTESKAHGLEHEALVESIIHPTKQLHYATTLRAAARIEEIVQEVKEDLSVVIDDEGYPTHLEAGERIRNVSKELFDLTTLPLEEELLDEIHIMSAVWHSVVVWAQADSHATLRQHLLGHDHDGQIEQMALFHAKEQIARAKAGLGSAHRVTERLEVIRKLAAVEFRLL